MYKAFDRVNYNTLDFRLKPPDVPNPPNPGGVTFNPRPLVELACQEINCNYDLIKEAVGIVPTHMVPLLMKVAIHRRQPLAVAALVSHWPLHTLCFRDIVGAAYMRQSFSNNLCQTIKYNHGYVKLVSRVWPLLSLNTKQLDISKLMKHALQTFNSHPEMPTEMRSRHMPAVLTQTIISLLSKEVINNHKFAIKIPKGKTLEVLIDNIKFYNSSHLVMEYMVVNSLRVLTPLTVTPSTISIECDPRQTDDTSLPLAVFFGLDAQTLEGISIRQLADGVFNRVCKAITKFTKIRSLDISDCGLYLQHGRTRNRTSTRLNIMDTLNSFSNLVRLDLSQNYLVGCLKELLSALTTPLEYLNLNSCDLNHDDVTALVTSHHAANIRELNFAKITHTSVYLFSGIEPSFLASSLSNFTELRILNLSHNFLRSTLLISSLCTALCRGSQKLQVLDFQGNALTNENQLEMSFNIASIPTMQWLRFTYYCNLSEELSADLIDRNIANLQQRIDDRLRYIGRGDMKVDVSRLQYTVYLDLNL